MADNPPPFHSYSKETVYDTLKEHRWDSRAAARTLGIPYRKLDRYRREHNLYAHTYQTPLKPPGVESLHAGLVQPPFQAPAPETLEPISAWAKRQGLSYQKVRYLRDQNRLIPLFRYSEGIHTIYYALPNTESCPVGEHHPPLPLEGYESLHSLERDTPVLARLARTLIGEGRLHPLQGAQPLLSAAQLTWLRALQQADSQTDSESPDSEGLEAVYLESQGLKDAPSEVEPSARAWSVTDDARPGRGPRMQQSTLTERVTPYVPQPGYISVPRFELCWRAAARCTVLDRGERGEHVRQPLVLAEFYSDMVYAVFPVVDEIHDPYDDAPPDDAPPDAPPYNAPPDDTPPEDPGEGTPLEDPGKNPPPTSGAAQRTAPESERVQPMSALEDPGPPRPGGEDDRVEDADLAPATLPELDPVQRELEEELAQTRQQLEAVQRELEEELAQTRQQLEAVQRELEGELERAHERTKAMPRGQRRLPDRRLQVHETTLLERDRLQRRVSILEEENRQQLEDLLRLDKPQARGNHFAHVQKRLRERYGLEFSMDQVEALDRQVLSLPVKGVGTRGQYFKQLQLGEHTLYLMIVRDLEGAECIGTVYQPEMFERAQWRGAKSRAKNKTKATKNLES